MRVKFFIISLSIFISVFSFNSTKAAFPVQHSQTQEISTAQTNTYGSTSRSNNLLFSFNKLIQSKQVAKGGPEVDKTLYIVLSIVGLGWLGMGLNDDWKGSDWIISLLLSCLFWLPGVIYSLVKMDKYYK